MKNSYLFALVSGCMAAFAHATNAGTDSTPLREAHVLSRPANPGHEPMSLPADMAAFAADLENAPYRPVEVVTRGERGDTLYKYVYAYDKEGKDLGGTGPCIVRNHYKWDTIAKQFVNDVRFRAILDENEDMTLYYMDQGAGQHWNNYYRFVATYNANHDQVTASQEYWENNAWFSRLRWENMYDDQGRITSQTYENRYTGTEWMPGSRYVWEYDGQGNETKYEMQTLQGGEYKPLSTNLRTYDERGNMLTRTLQTNGVNTMREVYVYNDEDSCILGINEAWNRNANAWYAQVRDTFIFEPGKGTAIRQVAATPAPLEEVEWVYSQKTARETYPTATRELSYIYDEATGQWQEKKRIINSTVDTPAGRQHNWMEDTLNVQTNQYVTINRTITTYNADGNISDYQMQTRVDESMGEDGTPFLTVFGYTHEYDEHGNATSVLAYKKGERNAIGLPYNNSLNQWDCPEFDSWSAEATYMDLNEYVMPIGVTFAEPEVELAVGDTIRLVAHVLPADASIHDLHWQCPDEDVAFVSVDGEVTALAPGTATITATTLEGRLEATASVTVTSASGMEAVSSATYVTCTGGQLTVHGDGIREVRVYATGGQLQAQSTTQFTFATGTWPQGVYLVQVVQGGQTRMHKVTVR